MLHVILGKYKIKKGKIRRRRGTWNADLMRKAVDKILTKKLPVRTVAKMYGIPRSSLHSKLQSIRQKKETLFSPILGRFTQTFDATTEEILLTYVKEMSNKCLPLDKTEFLRLAYQLAEENNIPHRFNNKTKEAGKQFFSSFMKRHGEELALKTPQSLSYIKTDIE